MTVILSPDGRCASTFVSPGDNVSKIRRCEGNFNHDGMHGSTEHGSSAWGDGAAYDHHPGEPLVIRTSELIGLLRTLQAQVADRDATIARLTAELAEARRKPSPCSDCNTTDEECMNRVKSDGRPCCGRCHITDTHGGGSHA